MMIALAVAVLGCGGKKSDGGGGGGKAKDADPAAANAAVPAELKGKLEFDTAKDAEDNVAWVKPKGWIMRSVQLSAYDLPVQRSMICPNIW